MTDTATTSSLPIGPSFPWLAPLAGFSDLPFRLLCREQGAAVACTEMVSAKGLIYGMRAKKSAEPNGTEELLSTTAEDAPLVVQLFGDEPEYVGLAARELVGRGFAYFDLNMGCSVPKVTRAGAGAALLRDPARAAEAARALFEAAGPGRAGCKLRLGWDASSPVYLELALRLEDMGAAWITLHPRYARQGFGGSVDLGALERLASALRIPVIASGDLFSAEDGLRRLETGVAGVMYARGAMANPSVFGRYLALLRQRARDGASPDASTDASPDAGPDAGQDAGANIFATREHDGARNGGDGDNCGHGDGGAGDALDAGALLALIRRHADLARRLTPGKPGRKGLAPALLKMRTVVPRYVRHLPGVKKLRLALTRCESWEELDVMLREFFDNGPSVSGGATDGTRI